MEVEEIEAWDMKSKRLCVQKYRYIVSATKLATRLLWLHMGNDFVSGRQWLTFPRPIITVASLIFTLSIASRRGNDTM